MFAPLIAALETAPPPQSNAEIERRLDAQASAAQLLLQLSRDEQFWPRLEQTNDPRLRTRLIDRIKRARIPWRIALARLNVEQSASARQAILLGLNDYRAELTEAELREAGARLVEMYESDADGGVHGAVEWLLRTWGLAEPLEAARNRLIGQPPGKRRWFLNSEGQTMLIFNPPGTIQVGSPAYESGRDPSEAQREATLDYAFAISAHEVTVEQYARFRGPAPGGEIAGGDGALPANFIAWTDAAEYCRWLSEKPEERIPESERCYAPLGQIEPGMITSADHLRQAGYRLPTEQEWEYAARAGAETSRFFGNSEARLSRYAWYSANASEHPWPVGLLQPNAFGLFDVLGNVSEWCDQIAPGGGMSHVVRGGTYRSTPRFLRRDARDPSRKRQTAEHSRLSAREGHSATAAVK